MESYLGPYRTETNPFDWSYGNSDVDALLRTFSHVLGFGYQASLLGSFVKLLLADDFNTNA